MLFKAGSRSALPKMNYHEKQNWLWTSQTVLWPQSESSFNFQEENIGLLCPLLEYRGKTTLEFHPETIQPYWEVAVIVPLVQ